MKTIRTIIWIAFLGLCIQACTLRTLTIGMTKAEVTQTWGSATRIIDLPSGQRWEYSSAKEGSTNFLLDFDASNKLIGQRQGLIFENFGRIKPEMSLKDVEAIIGESFWSVTYQGFPEQTNHVWRWSDGTNSMCFSVKLDKLKMTVIESGWYPETKPARGFGEPRRC
jgi:hypothetical protein